MTVVNQIKEDYGIKAVSKDIKLEFYFYVFATSDEQLEKYFDYLREVEDILSDRGYTRMQLQVCAPNCSQKLSKIGNAYRADIKEVGWWEFDAIKNSHWMIKMSDIPRMDPDFFVEKITEVNPVYENEEFLVVYHSFI